MAGQVFYKRKSDGAIIPINPGPKGDTGPQGDKGDPGPPGGAVLSGWWTYSTATTGPAPAGQVRTDPALSAIDSSGTFWLNSVDADGLDWTGVTVQVDSQFYLRDDQGNQWVLDVDAVNGTGDFTVTLVSSTSTAPKKNARVQVSLVQTTYTQAQLDARYVNADGDTMTGTLAVGPSSLVGNPAKTNVPVNIKRTDGGFVALSFARDVLHYYLGQPNDLSNFRLYKYAAAGGSGSRIVLQYIPATDTLDLTGPLAVTVPAPTAAQQVPRLARTPNPATGDLGLPGYVGSDTGWRDVKSSLLNGWTATTFAIRRQGTTVRLRWFVLNGGAASNDTLYMLPTGFSVENIMVRFITDVSGSALDFGHVQMSAAGVINTGRTITAGRAEVSWSTADPWPTSLPGTQVTPPASWT